KLNSPLPHITEFCTIDGYSQPGASQNTLGKGDDAKLLIELDGSNVFGDGLYISGGFCGIQGRGVNRLPGKRIFLRARGHFIWGNFIGTAATGTIDLGNGHDGINILTDFNHIGTSGVEDRNIISGNNRHGIYISGPTAANNGIYDNYIGTDATGTVDLGNSG